MSQNSFNLAELAGFNNSHKKFSWKSQRPWRKGTQDALFRAMLLFPETKAVNLFSQDSGISFDLGFHEVLNKLFRRLSNDPKLTKLVGLNMKTVSECELLHEIESSSLTSALRIDGALVGRFEDRVSGTFKSQAKGTFCTECGTKTSFSNVQRILVGEPPVVLFIELSESRDAFPSGIDRVIHLRISNEFETFEYEFVSFVKLDGKKWYD
jgi:hypothetical protein